MPDLAVKIQ